MEKIELIDQYLKGGMTEAEMVQFENTLNTDPVLKKEFQFQQEIVEAIKINRKNELKSQLSEIDVSGLTTTTSFWNTKTIATASIIGAGLIGAYVFYPIEDKTTPVVEDNSKIKVAVQEDRNLKEIESITDNLETAIVETTTASNTTKVESTDKSVNASASVEEEEERVSSDVNDDFGDFDDESFSDATPPKNFMTDKGEFVHSTIDVSVQNNKKKYTFHYQFKNNTLFLYGDFENLYEIIEFKQGERSDLYFVYENKYYGIDKSKNSITALEELDVENSMELNQKLNSSKEAKSQ